MANISWTALKEVRKDGTATISEMQGSCAFADFTITLKRSPIRTWPTGIQTTVKKGKASGAPTRASSPGDAQRDCQRFADTLEEYIIMQSKPSPKKGVALGFTHAFTRDTLELSQSHRTPELIRLVKKYDSGSSDASYLIATISAADPKWKGLTAGDIAWAQKEISNRVGKAAQKYNAGPKSKSGY